MSLPPSITPLPPAPSKADSKKVFDQKANAFVAALDTFQSEINALVNWMAANVNASPIETISGGTGAVSTSNGGSTINVTGTTTTITIPPDSDPSMQGILVGTQWIFVNYGTGAMSYSLGSGVDLDNTAPLSPGSMAILRRIAANQYSVLNFSQVISGGGSGTTGITAVTSAFGELTAANANTYMRFTYEGEDPKTLGVPAGGSIPNGAQWIISNQSAGAIAFDPNGGVVVNNSADIAPNTAGLLKKISNGLYDFIPFAGGGEGGGMTNPMTTAYDLIVGGSSGIPLRLPKGSNTQVLTIDGGTVVWKYPATVTISEFTASQTGSYAWSGFPTATDGNSYNAGGGSVSVGPYFDGNAITPGTVLDYSGIGVSFIEDSSTLDIWLVLVLPGATGDEVIELSGIPFYSTRTTTTADFDFNADVGQNLFAWNLGSLGGIPAEWFTGGVEMTIRRFS